MIVNALMTEPENDLPDDCDVRGMLARALSGHIPDLRLAVDSRVPVSIYCSRRMFEDQLAELRRRIEKDAPAHPVVAVYELDDSTRSMLRIELAGTRTGVTITGAAVPKLELPLPMALAILVVEDNPINQHLARECLEKLGFGCDIAPDGEQAVAAVKARNYDVIFMDVHMPCMDGLQATRAIRALPGPHRPLIAALTAYALPGDRARCLDAGMDEYVTKPCRLETLAAVLRKAAAPPQ